jgi:hypothetical protein
MATNVEHIISALESLTAELSLAAGSPGRPPVIANRKPAREQALASAKLIAGCRKRRAIFHPEFFFGEPCWDMLLDLFIASGEQRDVTVTQLCNATQVPYGTALRYIGRLESRGDVVRETDKQDQRRTLLRITEAASARMILCLGDMTSFTESQSTARA